MSDATIEVDGEVYELASSTMHDSTQTYTTGSGDFYAVQSGGRWLDAETSDSRARALVHNGALRCRVELGGLAYTGYVMLTGWSAGFSSIRLRVEDIKPIPAPLAPTLDELTDPADLDWGTIRSTCAARDWCAAWGVVGTDHTGDATPGEVYLLAVARRASATAAALHHWRKAEMESGTIFIGADAARAWQRIKRIAAWESSAAAQYDERGNRRGRLQAAVREQLIDAQRELARQARLYGRSTAWAVIDDPVGSFQQEYQGIPASDDTFTRTLHSLYNAEDDAVTRGNGGVPGVLNNPFLTAAAQRGEITGNLTFTPGALRALRDLTARVDAGARTLGAAAATTLEASRQIDALTRSTNPAPRGPQTRKRR